jgi:hypothetical protein
MEIKLWWKKPLRALQTNLQVKDTALMDPRKIAAETLESGSNALVINVGGIYAWYQSSIPYHHVNEYLPSGRDLLEQIITECHARDIRVIARFDFSKAEDKVYQQRPEWFVRYTDGSTRMYGKDRPGNWSLLATTCLNAGYRNEEVAVPVVEEVLDRYAIDGIFFNAPHYEFCCCDTCRQKYFAHYGTPMPEFPEYGANSPGLPEGLDRDWPSLCVKDGMELMYKHVKKKAPHVPIILYYNGHKSDHLAYRMGSADMICTESQDILSKGRSHIPQFWHPAISMKMGRTLENYPPPFGIIHSCPGMDWRHTGLPTAEYEFWMSQIPANGGMLWHSVTGFGDTISDKRILRSIGKINHLAEKTERAMHGARSAAQLLLLWEGCAEGLAEGLISRQRPFDIECPDQVTSERLARYKAVIVPDGFPMTENISLLLKEYVHSGGNLLVESGKPDENLQKVLGTGDRMTKSSYLTASYLRFRDALIQKELEETPLIPHRGETWYCRPATGTTTLATLVPPFAPLDAVGSPPERASILCPDTDIPLVLENRFGKGKSIYLSFGLGSLIDEFGLNEHIVLLDNLITLLLPDPDFHMRGVGGLQASVFYNQNKAIVHLINGVGQRPLQDNIPLFNLSFEIKTPVKAKSVKPLLEESNVEYRQTDETLYVTLKELSIWNAILVEW